MGIALQKGGEAKREKKKKKKKAWRKGKVQSLGFVAAGGAHARPVHAAQDCACCSAVPCLPPQGAKVLLEESPALSTLWKINVNSRGGVGTQPATGAGWLPYQPYSCLPLKGNYLASALGEFGVFPFYFPLCKRREPGRTLLLPGRARGLGLFSARAWHLSSVGRKEPTPAGERCWFSWRRGWVQLWRGGGVIISPGLEGLQSLGNSLFKKQTRLPQRARGQPPSALAALGFAINRAGFFFFFLYFN